MTVHENLSSGLKLKKVPRGEIQQRVANVVELLGLKELLHRKPGQLSGRDKDNESQLVEH